jgi:hypothetical protein
MKANSKKPELWGRNEGLPVLEVHHQPLSAIREGSAQDGRFPCVGDAGQIREPIGIREAIRLLSV